MSLQRGKVLLMDLLSMAFNVVVMDVPKCCVW